MPVSHSSRSSTRAGGTNPPNPRYPPSGQIHVFGEPGRHAVRRQPRRRVRGSGFAFVVVLLAAGLIIFDAFRARPEDGAGAAALPTAVGSPAATHTAGGPPSLMTVTGSSPTPSPSVQASGPGTFTVAPGQGAVVGRAGPLQHYRVAVEDGIGVDPAEFASDVETILGDPRGWTAGGDLRLQRVADKTAANFTVYLATPATSEQMCRAGGMETEKYTNCRRSDGAVVINLARWLTAVPGYGAPLDVYRAYAINHEVGHQLGQWHELCPSPGQPAPVMQQQTLGLQGCVANAWPYVEGLRYRGPTADS
jgi:hypothetical protein